LPGWGAFALGASAVFGTLGAAIYVKFADDRASFNASGDQDAALHATAMGERTATYVLWGISAASALAGGVAFVLSRTASSAHPAIRVGPGWVSAAASF
jgi:hypothetical protein